MRVAPAGQGGGEGERERGRGRGRGRGRPSARNDTEDFGGGVGSVCAHGLQPRTMRPSQAGRGEQTNFRTPLAGGPLAGAQAQAQETLCERWHSRVGCS